MEDHVAIARKSGKTWRIGVINQDHATQLDLSLTFLGDGRWELRAFSDSIDSDASAEDVEETATQVGADDVLKAHLASGGGYAAILTRME